MLLPAQPTGAKPRPRAAVPGTLLALLCLALAGQAGAAPSSGAPVSYRQSQLASLPWGAKPGTFGLAVPPDGETVGPRTFTVDALGHVYVLDTIKRNIKVFDRQGRFQASVGKNLLGYALACHEGHLYLLDGERLQKLTLDGRVVDAYPMSDRLGLREGYGQWLRVTEDGSLFVKSGRKAYRVFADLGEDLLPEEVQVRSERRGSPNREGSRWFALVLQTPQRQVLQVAEFDGTSLREIPLDADRSFGANYFLDEDRAGNVYVEVQTIGEDDRVHLEVRRYDSEGRLAVVLPMSNRYHTRVFKKLFVADDGSIYQLRTEPQGVLIDRWEQEKLP